MREFCEIHSSSQRDCNTVCLLRICTFVAVKQSNLWPLTDCTILLFFSCVLLSLALLNRRECCEVWSREFETGFHYLQKKASGTYSIYLFVKPLNCGCGVCVYLYI